MCVAIFNEQFFVKCYKQTFAFNLDSLAGQLGEWALENTLLKVTNNYFN